MVSSQRLNIGIVLVIAGILSSPSASFAHHSRSNFKFDTVLELEGTITDFDFRNPHTFLTLQTVSEAGETVEWLLASNSISSLKQAGWDNSTFVVGDVVTARGNPDRNDAKKLLFLDVITKADGTEYASGKIPPGGRVAEAEATMPGSTDFSGVWQPPFNPRNVASNFQAADLPMTAKGQPFVDAYDQADDPALDCVADAAPMTVLSVYPMQISRPTDDEVHFWYEQFDGRRVVHLGMDEHPAVIDPTHMGYSIGQIEGNVLTVDTRYFNQQRWGLGRGAPSGLQKHVTERYTLSDDGMQLDVEFSYEDPEYLAEVVTETGMMKLRPGYEMEAWDCDMGAARRHLSLE